jgi:hypothetical protein
MKRLRKRLVGNLPKLPAKLYREHDTEMDCSFGYSIFIDAPLSPEEHSNRNCSSSKWISIVGDGHRNIRNIPSHSEAIAFALHSYVGDCAPYGC